MFEYHVGLIGLLVGTHVFFTVLAVVNVRHGDRTIRQERDWLAETLDADADRILKMRRADAGLSLLRSWFVLGAILVALYGGPFERTVEAISGTDAGVVAGGVALFAVLGLGYVAVAAPIAAFEAFVVRTLLGVSPPKFVPWLVGQAVRTVALLVGALLGVGAVLAATTIWPALWWVGAWALIALVAVFGQLVYPQVRHRVLDNPQPVTEGPIYDAVSDVFERAGGGHPAVYRISAGRSGSKLDAHVSGFGQGRVVLTDAMIEELSTEELKGVVAHELAHLTSGHVWKGLAGPITQAGIVTVVLGILVDAPWLYEMFGLATDATAAGLALALVVAYPILRLTAPIRNGLTIAYEQQADAFASDVLDDHEPLRSALRSIAPGLLIDPFPHRAYVLFHHSHPPIPARLRALRQGRPDASNSNDS